MPSPTTVIHAILLLVSCALSVHAFASPPTALRLPSTCTSNTLHAALAIRMDGSSSQQAAALGAKIIMQKPESDGSAADSNQSASGTKVTVRVRPKVERTTTTYPPTAEPAEEMVTKVTVKMPENVPEAIPKNSSPSSLVSENLTAEEQALLDATQRANCSAILAALQAGANPNIRDPKGRTPLHFVSGLGLAPAAVLLIHFGAQVDVRDGDGLSPIHMASGYGNAQTLKVLVAAGADTDSAAPNQGTPTQVVVALGDYQLTQFMNRTGAEKLKKKDEKLEKLKACLDVLDNIESVFVDADWDAMLSEVLVFCGTE